MNTNKINKVELRLVVEKTKDGKFKVFTFGEAVEPGDYRDAANVLFDVAMVEEEKRA